MLKNTLTKMGIERKKYMNSLPTPQTHEVTISIIGHGVIGSALSQFFKRKSNILLNDPNDDQSINIDQISKISDLIFICVRAELDCNRNLSTEIVEDVLASLELALVVNTHKPLVCIKTTLLPNQLEIIKEKYKKLRICFSPEFARNKHAEADMVNLKSLVIGGDRSDALQIEKIYRDCGNYSSPFKTSIVDIREAGFMKYLVNSFLATKVSFMNQFYDVYSDMNCPTPWDELMDICHLDTRIGDSHYAVPGPDNKRGWGGKCFPTDLEALLTYCSSKELDLSIISQVCAYNTEIRKEEMERLQRSSFSDS